MSSYLAVPHPSLHLSGSTQVNMTGFMERKACVTELC